LRDECVFCEVNVFQRYGTGGVGIGDASGSKVDQNVAVVFLEGDQNFGVGGVDGNVFRFGIGWVKTCIETGHFDIPGSPGIGVLEALCIGNVDNGQLTGGKLRWCSVSEVLVTLVLDRDGDVVRKFGARLRNIDGIGLSGKCDLADDCLGRKVNDRKMSRGIDIVRGGVDAHDG